MLVRVCVVTTAGVYSIKAFKPKAGQESNLHDALKTHWETNKSEGLVRGGEPLALPLAVVW